MASRVRAAGFVVAACFFFVPPGAAFAQFASPKALVDHIYKDRYRTKDSPGIGLATRAEIARYFEPGIARGIERNSGPDGLNGDPFTNSQDRHFSGLRIELGKADGKTATAMVSFLREGDRSRTRLRFDMVKGAKGWLIHDIVESGGDAPIENGGSLRRLVKAKP
jgi:hypothetical protein